MVTVLLAILAFGPDWTTVVKPALKQVPRLQMLHEGEQYPGTCASVVINKEQGYLMTAAHCVEKPDKEGISITANGRHAEVLRVNRLLDLAVVRVDLKGEDAIEIADTTPPIGTEVAVVGYPFGDKQLAVQFGHIAQVLNEDSQTVWINVDVIFGDSGGALIDGQGKLVGLISRIYALGPAHMGACVPVETLRDFLKPYLPKTKVP